MSFSVKPLFDFWIIGYGNPQRRDDGIGPYIVKRLKPF
jgi:Ni,Fe-hydrogenase maturation factor